MKKQNSGQPHPTQLAFDFTFNHIVETANQLKTNEIEGDQNVREQRDTSDNFTHSERSDASSSTQTTLQPVRLENSRSLGNEHSRKAVESGETGRNGASITAARTTDIGTKNTDIGGLTRSDEQRDDSLRTADAIPNQTRIVEASDYIISDDDKLGSGGAKAKFKDNINALTLLKRLQLENRQATREEQTILVKYVGWGGLPQAFDHRNPDWKNEFNELANLLASSEYESARRSTQDAHYTSQEVIDGIFLALQRFGVTGGSYLEPSIGSGNFIGLMPPEMKNNAKITGIELDDVTAKIAKYLYPSTTVINKAFQDVVIPSGYFDVALGNPPFGNQRVYDPNHAALSELSIHNYFIAKSLEKVREGGVTAFVVSHFFMDANNKKARSIIADQAHFIGAIRLPNSAFKKNALTSVTTDIVFFKKASLNEQPDRTWVDVGNIAIEGTDEKITLNHYFVEHPEMMLGTMALQSNSFSEASSTLVAFDNANIGKQIKEAINKLPENIYSPIDIKRNDEAPKLHVEIPVNTKVGAYFISNSKLARRLPDVLDKTNYEWIETKNRRMEERILGMIAVRNTLREQIQAEQSENTTDAQLITLRATLNRVYDEFVKQHGFISSLVNRTAMSDDPDYPLLHALEKNYDKGISKEVAIKHGVEPREASAEKASIFEKRVIAPHRSIEHVDSVKDALVVSMNDLGRIDLGLMCRLTNKSEEAVTHELEGFIYLNPTSKQWETAEQYLSGNVKEKLSFAEKAAFIDPRYLENVHALQQIQPADIESVDIAVQLGSPWVPAKYVDDFVKHLLGDVHRSISYQPAIGRWIVSIGAGDAVAMKATWGTQEIAANELITCILTNKPIEAKIYIGVGESNKPILKLDESKTAVANQKADEIRQAFIDWIWEDKNRRTDLTRLYNDKYNTNVLTQYDGAHLTLPSASQAITLRPHQKNAIWRGIQDGSALFDHVVGAGKTIVCVATAMESKRMGLLKKPMFIVPNHLLLQWKDSFYDLYPNANILVAEKSDFTKENRQKLFSKITTGDWDAVIVAHSSFKKIGMPHETLTTMLDDQIHDLTFAILKLKTEKGDRLTIKEMEKTRDRMKEKLLRVADTGKKDTVVSFEDLGVDALFVDESHEFKNLFITTSQSRVAGLGNLVGSEKAFDLFIKARYIQNKNEGRGLFFATGTPISNTIAELYTIQRYMQYGEMNKRGIVHFDAWAATFGSVVSGWELDATGANYRLNSRFSRFQNVPELVGMYRSFADVISKSDLDRQANEQGKRFPIPKLKGGKPRNVVVDRSPEQAQYMGIQIDKLDADGNKILNMDGLSVKGWTPGSIIYRMENLPKDPSKDNPLKITNDARKAGLDFRLVDPSASDFAGSKVNVAVEDTFDTWQKWNDLKGTQLVFCDLSTPKGTKKLGTLSSNDKDDAEELESIAMDELLSRNAHFSVYDDFKKKLVARGIPEKEICFIHDAKTDVQKLKLFDQMNKGEIRILIGSTAKMGAGMNVQRRLVALRELDAPWRPSDLEQREGRILRQGNMFYEQNPDGFEIEIVRYATKQTYDSRMWQTIQVKAEGIEQFRKGDALQRVIEDIAGEAANAAEMKAAATGNRLIFTQVQISAELKKVEAFFSNYKRNKFNLEKSIVWLTKSDERADKAILLCKKEIDRRNANTPNNKTWHFYIDGKRYGAESKTLLLELIGTAMKETTRDVFSAESGNVKIAHYRGFEVGAISSRGGIQFTLDGFSSYAPDNLLYRRDDKFSLNGFIQRIDHCLDLFDVRVENYERRRHKEHNELQQAKAELAKPFQHETLLKLLRKDAGDVLVELKKMQSDQNYESTWIPASLEYKKNQTQIKGAIQISNDYNPSEEAIKAVAHLHEKGISKDKILLAMRGFDSATKKLNKPDLQFTSPRQKF